MSHIFISYARKDINWAKKIVQALTTRKLDTWIDWKSIPKSVAWEEEIYRGIEEADAFVFMISPDSVRSRMCKKEIKHAVKNNKRIIPIVIRDTDSELIPSVLAKLNWIFCRDGSDNFKKAILEVRTAIHTDYKWLVTHRELQVKALKWVRRNQDIGLLLRGNELQSLEQILAGTDVWKDPQPTKLQRQYVLASRKFATRIRNLIIIVSVAIGIVLGALGIYAQVQSGIAVQQAKIAEQNADQSERQARIAVARRLADLSKQESGIETELLLAIESMNLAVTTEGSDALIQALELTPYLHQEIAFTGNHVVSMPITDAPFTQENSTDRIEELRINSEGNNVIKINVKENNLTIIAWDIKSGEKKANIEKKIGSEGSLKYGKDLAISKNGKWIAFLDGNKIVLLNSESNHEVSSDIGETRGLSISFSHDGQVLLLVSADGLVNVWRTEPFSLIKTVNLQLQLRQVYYDLAQDSLIVEKMEEDGSSTVIIYSGKEISDTLTLAEHSSIRDFSVDYQYIALAVDRLGTVIWNLPEQRKVMEIPDEKFVSFDNTASFAILLAGNNAKLNIWDLKTGHKGLQLVHPCTIHAIALTKDEKRLAVSCYDGTVSIWEVETGKLQLRFSTGYVVDRVEFSPDEKFILTANVFAFPVTAYHTNQANLWDAQTGKEIARLAQGVYYYTEGFAVNQPSSIIFDKSGRYLLAADDEVLRIWDLAEKWSHQIASIWYASPGLPGSVQSGHSYAIPVFSSKGGYLAIGGGNANVQVWQLDPTLKMIGKYPPESGIDSGIAEAADTIVFSPDGTKIAFTGIFCQGAVNCENDVRIMRVGTSEKVLHIDRRGRSEPGSGSSAGNANISFSADSQWLVNIWDDGVIHVWDTENWQLFFSASFEAPNVFAYTPSRNQIAIIDQKWIKLIDIKDRSINDTLQINSKITALGLSNNGRFLAIADTDGSLKLWDIERKYSVASITLDSSVNSIFFDYQDKFIAASDNQTLSIWDPFNNVLVASVGLPERFGSYDYGLNGMWAITGTPDSVLVLNTDDGEEITHFPINLIHLSPNRQYYTAQAEITGTVGIWQWNPNLLINAACSRVSRNFTMQEWLKFFENMPYKKTCPNKDVDASVSEYYVETGDRYARSGSIEQAIKQYLKANIYSAGLITSPEGRAHTIVAEALLYQGDQYFWQGDKEKALSSYNEALNHDPEIIDDPEHRIRILSAKKLLESGDYKAATGDIAGAVSDYEAALELDPTIAIDPQSRANKIASHNLAWSLRDAGDEYVNNGQLEEALLKYQEAMELEPGIIEDPQAQINNIRASLLLQDVKSFLEEGDLKSAISTLFEVWKLRASIYIDADIINAICWYGSLYEDPIEVKTVCERAVLSYPNDGNIRDSRGVNRALLGNFDGAIQDFIFFVNWAPGQGISNEIISERMSWIQALQEGKNPFDYVVLNMLKNE